MPFAAHLLYLLGRMEQLGIVGLVEHRKELDPPRITALFAILIDQHGTRR